MKEWIKIETCLHDDPRIVRLCDELGAKGLGIYLTLRVLTDQNVKGCTMRTLCEAGSYLTSRRNVVRVITEFDLFDKIGAGLYHATPLFSPYAEQYDRMQEESRADAREDACAPTREDACELTREGVRADVPLSEREENRKRNYIKESGGEKTEEEKTFLTYMQNEFPNVCLMKRPMTYVEFMRLLTDYPRELVHSVLSDMENRPDLTKNYLSANLTCRSWINIRRRKDRNQ